MDNEKSIDSDSLVREILRYLVANPRAKDTISGIEKWWLAQSVSLESRSQLEQGLESLVSKDWLVRRCSPQSETIYSLNENALTEIQKFLESN
jgi:hypothetical protein